MKRNKTTYTFRLSEEAHEKLQKIADRLYLNLSDTLELLIRAYKIDNPS